MNLKTAHISVFVLYLSVDIGVFGSEKIKMETMSVMVGDSVTLNTDVGEIKRNDHILWMFGSYSPDTQIAEIIKWSYMFSTFVYNKERFTETLQLDNRTGSLTIKNIRTRHSGVYKLTVTCDKKTSYKAFTVKVYASLPIPNITTDYNSSASARSSGPKCVLLCSVRNVTRSTLSFYKGNILLSNISVSDNATLSLEAECHDKNTYRCVLTNSINNQTKHLSVIDLCQPCSDVSPLYYLVLLLLIPLTILVIVGLCCACRKLRKAKEEPGENC